MKREKLLELLAFLVEGTETHATHTKDHVIDLIVFHTDCIGDDEQTKHEILDLLNQEAKNDEGLESDLAQVLIEALGAV